jgi:hypothetical protein
VGEGSFIFFLFNCYPFLKVNFHRRWQKLCAEAFLLVPGSSGEWNQGNLAFLHQKKESRWPCLNVALCTKTSEVAEGLAGSRAAGTLDHTISASHL